MAKGFEGGKVDSSPEGGGFDLLNGFRLFPYRIQTHTQEADPILQFIFEVIEGRGFLQAGCFHPGHQQVQLVGLDAASDIGPLHERREVVPQAGDGNGAELAQSIRIGHLAFGLPMVTNRYGALGEEIYQIPELWPYFFK